MRRVILGEEYIIKKIQRSMNLSHVFFAISQSSLLEERCYIMICTCIYKYK